MPTAWSILADVRDRAQVVGAAVLQPGLELALNVRKERRLEQPLVDLRFHELRPVALRTLHAHLSSLFHKFLLARPLRRAGEQLYSAGGNFTVLPRTVAKRF